MTIRDALYKSGYEFPKHKGLFGLEVETETDEAYDVPTFSFWDVHTDGSLRGFGREYVFKQPLDIEVVDEALKEFKDKLSKVNFRKNSITTSVHAHVNMLNESFATFGNFLTTYALTENLLIKYSGEGRNSNMFCLPICDAEDTYKNIVSMFKAMSKAGSKQPNYSAMSFDREVTKYAALNLSSLARFGSLEVRSFKGTTDTKEIRDWLGILYEIVKFSRSDKMYPADIITAYKDRGVELLTDIFGKYRKDLKYEKEEKLIENNFWYAANIALAVPDQKGWDRLDNKAEPTKKAKASDLDALSMKMFGKKFEDLRNHEQIVILGQNEVVGAGVALRDDEDEAAAWENIREAERIAQLRHRAAINPIPAAPAQGVNRLARVAVDGVGDQPIADLNPWRD